MGTRMRPVFWAESGLACMSGVLAVLTAVWPDWIEALTGFDPDHGGGAFEWILAVGCGLSALVLGAIARREWRRTLSAAPA